MSHSVHIVAIFYPAPGKHQRFYELMDGMIKDVHQNEEYTTRYMMTEQINEQVPEIVMIESYKDEEAANKHTSSEVFANVRGTLKKEGIFAKPPYLIKTLTKGGFDLDRKLV